MGGVVAVLYFLVVQYVWKSQPAGGSSAAISNLIFAVGGFIIFSAVTYFMDRSRYLRYLRKQKGSTK